MARYIKIFANSGETKTAIDNETLSKPYVVFNTSTSGIDYDTISAQIDYSTIPFTVEAMQDGYVGIRTSYLEDIVYSINGGSWNSYSSRVSVNSGDTVAFKATDNDKVLGSQFMGDTTVRYNLYGNIGSLIYGDDFLTTDYSDKYCYMTQWIYGDEHIVDTEHLILPFMDVSSIQQCYAQMFRSCTNLVSAPTLPATILGSYCYYQMFNYCENLNYIKCLATTNIGSDNTYSWVQGVASTGTFVKKSGVNWPTGENGIPSGWTVIEE